IDGSVRARARREALERITEGGPLLVMTTPETLAVDDVSEALEKTGVGLAAVDEAHCISEWGHDFRPAYRRLGKRLRSLGGPPILALTATATPRVREDILRQLQLRDPRVLVGSFDRPNLTYRIRSRENRRAQILEEVRRHAGEAMIIYALSRRDTEQIAEALQKDGVPAAFYHAGLSRPERNHVHERFAREQLDVVVATVAFGMGIDRSNVRAVIHASMPRSIEHYQQETGRAGRDGDPAECVLLHSYADVERWRSLAERSFNEAMSVTDDPESLRAGFESQEGLL
ncbi:MAG: ATP-dependent DNA helicase RecQ, partial [Phycisphaeraceae bacterium]|nr:ATP-dependent DNA helicase RecQ [Phycisphaeraceae bacterium]